MIIFDYAFYGKNRLWIKYYRRGQSFEIDTDRPTSPRLYGIMLRSIASKGGGPGSRWTYLQAYGRSWKTSARESSSQSPGHRPPIWDMTDLRYDDPSGQDDIYVMDDSDDIYVMPDFFQYQSVLQHVRAKAATKIEALSGEPQEDIVHSPLMLED